MTQGREVIERVLRMGIMVVIYYPELCFQVESEVVDVLFYRKNEFDML